MNADHHDAELMQRGESTESSVLDRREFVRLAGASLALAGLGGCTRLPAEHILPYVDNRPELTPGVARHFATAMTIDGFATGLIVKATTVVRRRSKAIPIIPRVSAEPGRSSRRRYFSSMILIAHRMRASAARGPTGRPSRHRSPPARCARASGHEAPACDC